jgi:hypothetical protein
VDGPNPETPQKAPGSSEDGAAVAKDADPATDLVKERNAEEEVRKARPASEGNEATETAA